MEVTVHGGYIVCLQITGIKQEHSRLVGMRIILNQTLVTIKTKARNVKKHKRLQLSQNTYVEMLYALR